LATALSALGAVRGARVALLSEDRAEYLEIVLAAAHIGAVVACQNWRLTPGELLSWRQDWGGASIHPRSAGGRRVGDGLETPRVA